MKFAVLALIAFVFANTGCAGPYPPPGGPRPVVPPAMVGTAPEAMSLVVDWNRPVVFVFDERISQQGLSNLALVSPETGMPRVSRQGNEVRVTIDGGWQQGLVYQVVLLPGVRDLFGNTRREAAELVFSTGPPLPETAIAGMVSDRLTGRPVAQARIEAVQPADDLVYVAASDTAGFFALRFLPPGEYLLRAYQDQNRNREPDFNEPQASAPAELAGGDTLLFEFALLAPDTTPARLLRAEARDSTQVRLFFDDYLDPAEPLDSLQVELFALPDSSLIPVEAVLFPHQFEALRRAAAPRDTLVADTAAVVRQIEARRDEPIAQPAEPLPTRELVLVPGTALVASSRYFLEVRRLSNIAGVPGGGGSADFETPAWQTPPNARNNR